MRHAPDAIDLRSSFGPSIEKHATSLEGPKYYASTLPPGRERFVDMFQESAFWSKHLYRLSSWLAFVPCAVLVIAALCFILLQPTGATGILSLLAQLMVPILTFFVSADLLGQGTAWLDAARMSDRIDRALGSRPTPSEQDLLATFSAYSVATASAPPIPTFLYRRKHDHLNREWQRRREGGDSASN